jgi:hypothetical protein
VRNSDFVIACTYDLTGSEPDWDQARARVAKGFKYWLIADSNVGKDMDTLLDFSGLEDEDEEEYLRQAGEILNADIDACAELWTDPESSGPAGGMGGAERDGTKITVRGKPWPTSGNKQDFLDPYWRFRRLSSLGCLRLVGFKSGEDQLIDLRSL